MSVKITDKPTATSMSTADKIFANIGGALKQITKEMFLKDTHDKIDQVNSNLSDLSDSKLKGYTIGYNIPANTGGWHKIAQITGLFFNFDLYATGGWTNQRKSNAHFHIQNINGTVRIVQLSGLSDSCGGITKIRMVRVVDDKNTWILEEHSWSSVSGEFFKFTIAGDVTVTPLDGSVDTSTDFKDSVSLYVSDIPTGSVVTTSNIDNALSSKSANPVQNMVVNEAIIKLESDISNLTARIISLEGK